MRTSPDLMAALSMLCSQALNSSESERWYHALQEYAAAHPEPEEHRLAESWLLYLDISLPHRGSAGLLELMEQAGKTMAEDHLLLPDISVTGGQPSLINGSKDFCDWTKDDEAMAKRLETVAPAVLGPGGKGLAHLALAESLFEKAGDPYRVMALTNRGLMETMDGGKFELQFVGAALLARSYLLTGHVEDSLQAGHPEKRAPGAAECPGHDLPGLAVAGPGGRCSPLAGSGACGGDPVQCAGAVLL